MAGVETVPLALESAPPAPREMDAALARGIAWTGAAKWGSQLLAWVSTMLVARLLSPSDYGLVGLAGVYVGLVTLLSEFGLGAAVLLARDFSEEQAAQANTVSVGIGVLSFLVSCAAAAPLGWFFSAPELPAIVATMSVAFILNSFRTVPQSLLQRELRFKLLAFFDGAQAVVLAGAMVAFAVLGFGYWTLVWGGLLSAALSTLVVVAYRRVPFAWPRRESVGRLVTLSGHIIVGRLSWYAYSNADFVVAGRVLGSAPLGIYTFAWSLASVPIDKISALVGRVTPAVFSAVQTDTAALRRYLLLITEGLAIVTIPLTAGLALTADGFVALVLGPKWADMVVPLRFLAAYAAIQCLVALVPTLLNVVGETRFLMRNSIAAALLLPPAFYFASRWGIEGIAATWVVAYPLVISRFFPRLFRHLELGAREYLRSLWPAASSTLLMAAVVLGLQSVLAGAPLALGLAAQVTAGAAAYLAALVLLHRSRMQSFWQILRLVRG